MELSTISIVPIHGNDPAVAQYFATAVRPECEQPADCGTVGLHAESPACRLPALPRKMQDRNPGATLTLRPHFPRRERHLCAPELRVVPARLPKYRRGLSFLAFVYRRRSEERRVGKG